MLAAVATAHAGLLLAAMVSRPSAAPAISPPAVLGVLVSAEVAKVAPVAPAPTPAAAPPRPAVPTPPLLAAPPFEQGPVQLPPSAESAPAVDAAPAPAVGPAPDVAQAAGETEGEPVLPPRSDAAHLNNPKPVYPSVSRRFKEEGTVVLDVFIQADGTVGELRVRRSSGFPRLDAAALAAVRHWKYVPARRGKDPLALWYSQSLVFSLVR